MSAPEDSLTPERNHASEIIVSGPVWRAVWYVAWPTAVSTTIGTAYMLINRFFVGRLPHAPEALAAVGNGNTALMIQFAIVLGLSVGASALVARFVGAVQNEAANEAAGQAITASALAGIVLSVPFVVFAGPVLSLMTEDPEVLDLASDYAAITACFGPPLFVYFIAQSILRSAGEVRAPLYAGAVTVVLNILFDWLLIFGIGPFPMLGVRGAAIATGISRIGGVAIMLWFLRRSVLKACFRHLRPRWEWFVRILNIGWPASAQNLVFTASQFAFVAVLGFLPQKQATDAQAAYSVALGIESLAFMPGIAYGAAATPLVGQNLGAGNPARAEHTAWVAAGQSVMIMTAVAVLFVTVPRWLATLFVHQESVVRLIVSYLLINAVSEPFLAVGMVMRGALQGAGDTRIPAWISVFTLVVLRLPLTWVLAVPLGFGANGAWVAMCATTVLGAFLFSAWFKWGTWRTQRV